MAERNDSNKRRRRNETYDPGDWSNDSSCTDNECLKKDRDIHKYKDKVRRYHDLTNTLVKEKEQLKEDLKEVTIAKEDFEKKYNAMVKCVREQHTREIEKDGVINSVNRDKLEVQKKLDEMQKQFANTQRLNRDMKSAHSEAIKRSDTTIKKLEKDMIELNTKLKTKTEEDAEGMDEKNQLIERLQNEVKCKAMNANKYKEKFEKCRTEYMSLKQTNKRLAEDNSILLSNNHSLKEQRKYFENQNENNKRKNVGVSQTLVKQKNIYHKMFRDVTQNSIDMNDKTCDQLIEFIQNLKKQKKSQILETTAKVVQEVADRSQEADQAEKRIIEKRADQRVNCGDCVKTFGCPRDLAHHMTVTHKINVTDRSKNVVQFDLITIE